MTKYSETVTLKVLSIMNYILCSINGKYEEKYLDMMKPNFEKHSNNIILPLL